MQVVTIAARSIGVSKKYGGGSQHAVASLLEAFPSLCAEKREVPLSHQVTCTSFFFLGVSLLSPEGQSCDHPFADGSCETVNDISSREGLLSTLAMPGSCHEGC